MSFLTSLSSSIYLYIIAGLLTLVVVFGGLSWHLKGVADEYKAELGVAVDANSTLQESLVNKEKSCEITDKLLSEYQAEKNEIVDKKNDTLSAIDRLPSTPRQTTVKSNEKSVAGIDDTLPNELISLLQSSSVQDSGSTTVHP